MKKTSLLVGALFLLLIFLPTSVLAGATMTPASTSALLGFPAQFSCTGLDPLNTYSVTIDDSTKLSSLKCSTGGELKFSVSVSTAGYHLVKLLDNLSATVATSTFEGIDIMGTLIPAIVVLVSITILFGVVKELKF